MLFLHYCLSFISLACGEAMVLRCLEHGISANTLHSPDSLAHCSLPLRCSNSCRSSSSPQCDDNLSSDSEFRLLLFLFDSTPGKAALVPSAEVVRCLTGLEEYRRMQSLSASISNAKEPVSPCLRMLIQSSRMHRSMKWIVETSMPETSPQTRI